MKCTISIRDETNCLFVGLDRDASLVLTKMLTFHVPGARHTPRYRLGQWDGTVSLFKSGWTNTNLINEEMIGYLEGRGFEIDIDDQRADVSHVNFDEVTAEGLKEELPPSLPMLRDYQVAAINKALKSRAGIFLMATSAGKTNICAVIAKRYATIGKVMVIVPRTDLVEQTAKSFIAAGIDAGMFYADEKVLTDVVVSTWQSLSAYPEIMEGVQCVIADECHTVKADVLSGIMTGAAKHVPFRFGFTGTLPPDPLSAARVKAALGEVLFEKAAWELIEAGYLSTINIHGVQLQEAVKNFADFSAEYTYLSTSEKRLSWIARFITELSEKGNTFVLVNRIETGKKLQSMIEGSVFVSGGTKVKQRKSEYSKMSDGDNLVIIATGQIASTGLDIPRIYNLVMLDARKAFTEVIQSIGRGLRKVAGDKEHIDVFDVHASTKYSKRHFSARKKFYEEAKYPVALQKVPY